MSRGNIGKRLEDLESADRRSYFGLPRDPGETDALLARIRAEQLRRIRADPGGYGHKVADTLGQLTPAERDSAVAAINDGLKGLTENSGSPSVETRVRSLPRTTR